MIEDVVTPTGPYRLRLMCRSGTWDGALADGSTATAWQRPDGRVVVDVAPWGAGVVTRHVRLETAQGRSGRFPWTVVGADAIQAVARAAGLGEATGHRYADRWWAVVEVRS